MDAQSYDRSSGERVYQQDKRRANAVFGKERRGAAPDWSNLRENQQKQITKTANWYFALGETPYFVVYSTEIIENPTILYASKGKQAIKEKNALKNILEWYDGTDTNAEGYDNYSQKKWSTEDRRVGYGNGAVQARNAIGNDSMDVEQSWKQCSKALKTVLKNLQKISHKAGPGGAGPILAEDGGTEQQGGVSEAFSMNADVETAGDLVALLI